MLEKFQKHTPPTTKKTVEKQPFEDASPFEKMFFF